MNFKRCFEHTGPVGCILIHRILCSISNDSVVCSTVYDRYHKSKIGALHCCVVLQDEVYVNGAIILPHKEIKASILEPKIVL